MSNENGTLNSVVDSHLSNNSSNEPAASSDVYRQEAIDMGDLFGDDEEDDMASAFDVKPSVPLQQSSNDLVSDLFGEEAEETVVTDGVAIRIPEFPRLGDEHQKVTLATLPRFIGYSKSLYEESTYDEEQERADLTSMGKADAFDSIIRYRKKRDANGDVILNSSNVPLLESNARIVEWENGSLTLHIGDEVFPIQSTTKKFSKEKKEKSEAIGGYIFSHTHSVPIDSTSSNVEEESLDLGESILLVQAPIADRYVVNASQNSIVQQKVALESRRRDVEEVKERSVTQKAILVDPEREKQRRIREIDEETRGIRSRALRVDANGVPIPTSKKGRNKEEMFLNENIDSFDDDNSNL